LSQIGLPVVVFLIVVLLSYWLLIKLLGITSRLAIWVAIGVYIVTSAYAVLTAHSGSLELIMSGLLVCAALIPGIVTAKHVGGVRAMD